MLPYAGYVDPESTLAIGVHHDGHLEATERTFCSLYHTFMFGFTPFAVHPSSSNSKIRVQNSYWSRYFFEAVLVGQRCVHGVRISHTNFSLDPHRYLHEVMCPVHTALSSHNTFCVRFSLIQIWEKNN